MDIKPNILGIDFGTSNSAVATLENGKVKRLHMEAGSDTLPSAVFFDFTTRETTIGSIANHALTEGLEGRYMRSLKLVLGTSLMREKRYMMGQRLDFFDIISGFISELKVRAEKVEGKVFTHVLSGRPVHFHDDPVKDQHAEVDLRECYHRAGFTSVDFLFEPEAAAIANNVLEQDSALGLIIDIGGGTSDYSVFQSMPGNVRSINILASHGERIGGTDFDKTLNVQNFMPLLGKDGKLRRVLSAGTTTAPIALFNDLATWEKIPFMYSRETLRTVQELRRHALDSAPFVRLINVLEYELAHELSMLAESAKIAVNQTTVHPACIDLGLIETGKEISISHAELDQMMAKYRDRILGGVQHTLAKSGCDGSQITDVIFVGGSSLMAFIITAMQESFPTAKFHTSAVFTAVVDGLAIAAHSNA